MEGWLLDVFREENLLTAWIKQPTKNSFVKVKYANLKMYLHACSESKNLLERENIEHKRVVKKDYKEQEITVYEVNAPVHKFESFVSRLERISQHKIPFYNADIAPEQHFLFSNNIKPGDWVQVKNGRIQTLVTSDPPVLKTCFMHVQASKDPQHPQAKIIKIKYNNEIFEGEEKQILADFTQYFEQHDPDLIEMYRAFAYAPLLDTRLRIYGIKSKLHRQNPTPIQYRGGSTFYSYGQVRFRDYGVRLRGRFLIDTTSAVGDTCDCEGIFTLCQLSGVRYQHLASRSTGSVFQGALTGELLRDDKLIAYKQKPLPKPVSMSQLVEQDRAGLSLDPIIGLHTDVAELDFTSMFPHLMVQKNISPEKLGRGEYAPGVSVQVDQEEKGYIPRSLKRFLDLRLEYKKNPTALNKKRAKSLKGVLVCANGYLRFREFKLGHPQTHVALCAWVREAFLKAKSIAEKRGFHVLHGLVDSVYVQKPGITQQEVLQLKQEIEDAVNIPMSFEGIFSWIVFLPSRQDETRAVLTRYFGAFTNGSIKVRGLEARQHSQPPFIKQLQQAIIHHLAQYTSKEELQNQAPKVLQAARNILAKIDQLPANMLTETKFLGKEHYDRNIPQKDILQALKKQGLKPRAGQKIRYVMQAGGKAVLPQKYNGRPEKDYYQKMLARALWSLLQPLGYTYESILLQLDSQQKIEQFTAQQQEIHLSLTNQLLQNMESLQFAT